jgi:hypothetical protein
MSNARRIHSIKFIYKKFRNPRITGFSLPHIFRLLLSRILLLFLVSEPQLFVNRWPFCIIQQKTSLFLRLKLTSDPSAIFHTAATSCCSSIDPYILSRQDRFMWLSMEDQNLCLYSWQINVFATLKTYLYCVNFY